MSRYEELGVLVRRARESKGWTQKDLAERVGVSRPSITQLERGNVTYPRLPVLASIAAQLDIPTSAMAEFIGLATPETGSAQLYWLGSQLDAMHLRLLVAIGHSLLTEQHDPPQKAVPPSGRPGR